MKTFIQLALAISLCSIVASAKCDPKAVEQERKEIISSPYWTSHLSKFALYMNADMMRQCSPFPTQKPELAFSIFMDELEALPMNPSKRVLSSYGPYSETKHEKQKIYFYTTDSRFYQENVIEVHLMLYRGEMKLLAKTCSPKRALAELIALREPTLNIRCDFRPTEEIEKEIEDEIQQILSKG